MEIKFKLGDTVILKSGGPIMTVTKYITTVGGGSSMYTGNIECTWFFGNELKYGTFPQDALKLKLV